MKKIVLKVLTAMVIAANTMLIPTQALAASQNNHVIITVTQDPRGMTTDTQDGRG